MAKQRIIDRRNKEKFFIDDLYLNGYAKLCGWKATIAYISLCRHANKDQYCFPSIAKMAEENAVSRDTIMAGLDVLVEWNIINIVKERSKQGLWKNNAYILIDKTDWKPKPVNETHVGHSDTVDEPSMSATATRPCRPQRLDHVGHSDTKEPYIKEPHKKELVITNVITAKAIDLLIEMFKPVNPSIARLYSNKTERKAVQDLVATYGQDEIERLLRLLPKIVARPYAPRITTPYQLLRDMGKLKIFMQQERTKDPVPHLKLT